jgi:microcystin-dependent protein
LKKGTAAAFAAAGLTAAAGLRATDARAGPEPFLGKIMLVGFSFRPRNWIKADGRRLPVATSSALLSLLGKTFGGGGQQPSGGKPRIRPQPGRRGAGADRRRADRCAWRRRGLDRTAAAKVSVQVGVATAGSGTAIEVTPPYLAVRYGISVQEVYPSRPYGRECSAAAQSCAAAPRRFRRCSRPPPCRWPCDRPKARSPRPPAPAAGCG